jgi:CarD family transcriptional regulator
MFFEKGTVSDMYCVGDKVVHPLHGAGIIEEIKEMEIVGVKRKYYVVRFAIGNMVTNIPIESSESIGIRSVIDKTEAKKVLQCFRDAEIEDDANWNKRQRDNLLKIKSGDIYQVLAVLKELMYREKSKGLSTSERKTLCSARQIVVSELLLSEVAEMGDIESIMNDTVEELV